MDSVPLLKTIAPGTRFLPITFPVSEGWYRLNPSIAKADEGFRCTVRTLNSRIQDGRIILPNNAGPFQSEYVLAMLDDDLKLLSAEPMLDETDQTLKFRSMFLGFEDLRLYRNGQRWLATATTKEHDPSTVNQQVLLQLDGVRITGLTPLSTPHAGDQKNWMTVLGADPLTMVTDCYPTTVVSFDFDRGFTRQLAQHAAPTTTRNFRGGSHLVPVPDGYVCVIHETKRPGGNRRAYTHRVLHFTPDFHIDAMSREFFFQIREVEFCAGLALHDGRFILSFGENDAEAFLGVVPEREFLGLLEPV